jgi:hypothetical protein
MSTTNGATHHNGDATNHFTAAALKFDPTAAMQFWQKSAARFSRANEVLLRGFTAAAQMQVELSQELLQRQMSAFKQVTPGEKPDMILKTQMAHQTEETEHLFEAIRKISDKIRHSFTEATRTLLEGEAPELAESIVDAARQPEFTPARKSTAVALETRQST